jgi:hypothetical protein
MSVGINEIVVVVVSVIVVAFVTRKRPAHKQSHWGNRKWLWGVPAILAIASLTSPADPVSTLIFAVPTSALYVTALLRMERRLSPIAD